MTRQAKIPNNAEEDVGGNDDKKTKGTYYNVVVGVRKILKIALSVLSFNIFPS